MTSTDRRVRRTRRLLGNALLELIQEKPYNSITIRDVTTRADIGYATFFRHYDSIDDLLSETIEETIRGLEQAVEEGLKENYFAHEGTIYFQHAADNLPLYKGVFNGQVNRMVFLRLRDTVIRITLSHIEGLFDKADLLIPLNVATNHIAIATLELISWWLENDCPYSPEEMGRIYDMLIIRGTWQAILRDPTTLKSPESKKRKDSG